MADVKLLTKGVDAPINTTEDEDGFLIVRGKFTSDNVDIVGDVITKEATMAAVGEYRQWGNIRVMHRAEPVGVVVRIGEADGLPWNEVEIKVIDEHTALLVREGALKALSVGILFSLEDVDFKDDGGLIIRSYRMVEISLVDHPANYDAKLDDVKGVLEQAVATFGIHSCADAFKTILEEPTMETDVKEKALEEEAVEEKGLEELVEDQKDENIEGVPTEDEAEVEEETPVEEADDVTDEIEGQYSIEPLIEKLAGVLGSLDGIVKRLEVVEQALSETAEEAVEGEPVVDHKGAVQETEDLPEETEQADEKSITSLKSALAARFGVEI